MQALTDELSRFKKSITDELRQIKSSLQANGQMTSENTKKLEDIEKRMEREAEKFEGLILENKNLKARITELEVGLNQAEQEIRSKNVEIRGIPVRDGENLVSLVVSIGAGMGMPLKAEDLDSVERIRQRRDDTRPPPIIAKFARKTTRDLFVKERKVRRDFSTVNIGWAEGDKHVIYVSEDMSPMNKRLFYLARQARAAKKITYVWFSEGRVRCRKADGHRVVIVNIPEDLDVFG